MENPAWVPEIESPIIQAQHVATCEAAWNDPDFFNPTLRPLFIPPKFEQSPDPVNTDVNEITNVLRHRSVTHGERQLYVLNRTNDSNIYVLIGHLLLYMKMKMACLLNYLKNISWMTAVSF
jgi:hypothetical protein